MLLSLPVLPPPYSSEPPAGLLPWQRKRYRRLLHDTDPHCFYCRRGIQWKGSTLDHVVPCSRGGLNVCENLVLCCKSCNLSKRNRTALEWLFAQTQACARLGLTRDELLQLLGNALQYARTGAPAWQESIR